MSNYTESTLELTILERLAKVGRTIIHGPDIAHDGDTPLRGSYEDVILVPKLQSSLQAINPTLSADIIDDAVRQIVRLSGPKMIETNKIFHKMLTDGIDVSLREGDAVKTVKVKVLDTTSIQNNDFTAINQVTIIHGKYTRRPDVILYVNGLPLVVIELKNMTDENTTIKDAYHQIQTYKAQLEPLFQYNGFNVISDGLEARMGSMTADFDRFMSWKSVDGEKMGSQVRMLETLVYGALTPARLVDLITHFTLFHTDGENTFKILAAYHQYFAVEKAVASTVAAIQNNSHKAGVIRHTQGSGKSLTMVFYAGKIVQALENPTLLVITDRNDLDQQLYDTFVASRDLLRQTPQQADGVEATKKLLSVASGGIVFSTVQKFSTEDTDGQYPRLTDRSNVIVIADEAHRSQYGFKAKVKEDSTIAYGFAKYLRDALPNASFIGFTGTPIEFTDKNTKSTFGEYIDVYDIAQAVEDGATVPIYYEARLAKINLNESERPHIDAEFEELTEMEEMSTKEKLKSKWAQLEAMVGTQNRLALIAKDIVDHFEKRLSVMEGKGMIVGMSRRICVALYAEIIKLRPQRHSNDDTKGFIKVIMTGSASDPQEYQQHVRNKQDRDALARRMKDTSDPLKLVIVRDMWLTGFDVPSMHTMYIDKPMQGHGLMQAIARVNRVYKDKPAGLIVDYLGIATQLKKALSYYTQDGKQQEATIPQTEAIAVMMEKYEIIGDLFHGFEYQKYFVSAGAQRTEVLASSIEHILALDDGKKRFTKALMELTQAFAIAMPSDEAIKIRDDVAFFQAIKAMLAKLDPNAGSVGDVRKIDYDHAIKQIVEGAVTSDEVIDVFKVAGIDKPEIGILSEEFLEEVKNMQHKNMAFEILKKLLNDTIKVLERKNLIKSRSFAEMLEATIKKYQNRTIESAQVIAELIELAKKVKDEHDRGIDLNMSDEEIAFYDALASNESAVKQLGDETLKQMAHELVGLVKENATIDRTLKENVQAKLRLYIRRLLKKYKYPPDLEETATEIVLKQAKLSASELIK